MRLVDAEEIVKRCEDVIRHGVADNAGQHHISAECVMSVVKALPTVDAVPVVRCKDCKHHHYSVCEIPYCDRIDYGYGWKDEDFCSEGERKDGGNG